MLYIGADHRGFELKENLKSYLASSGEEMEDLGNTNYDPDDDFNDPALTVARKVAETGGRGVLLCGSGVGMDIVANKVTGVRAGLGFDAEQVRLARSHDDINVLVLAADYLDESQAKELVDAFLKTEFSGKERYRRRLEKINQQEAD